MGRVRKEVRDEGTVSNTKQWCKGELYPLINGVPLMLRFLAPVLCRCGTSLDGDKSDS